MATSAGEIPQETTPSTVPGGGNSIASDINPTNLGSMLAPQTTSVVQGVLNPGGYIAGLLGMGSQQETQATSEQTTLPSYLTGASQNLTTLGENIANTGYQPYSGQAVAPMSANQQSAYNMAQAQSANMGGLQAAANTPYSQSAAIAAAAPYYSGVIMPQQSAINQSYDTQRGALNSNPQSVAAQNAYCSGGNARNNAALNKAQTCATGTMMATQLPQAFNYGQSALEQNRAQAQQIVNSNQSALESTGQTCQNVRQAQDTFNYGQYLQGQQWNSQTLTALINSLKTASVGAPNSQSGTSSGQQSQNSMGSALGSAAGLIAAL